MARTPPRRYQKPTERPDAIATREGRYSWLITTVTPNVLTIPRIPNSRQRSPRGGAGAVAGRPGRRSGVDQT